MSGCRGGIVGAGEESDGVWEVGGGGEGLDKDGSGAEPTSPRPKLIMLSRTINPLCELPVSFHVIGLWARRNLLVHPTFKVAPSLRPAFTIVRLVRLEAFEM